ncbi:hypothetical protein BBJ28_00009873 [Nothophytophthora sp. Chile5]|nr:hypothetical protein BBJ28_00009873 [Nothophytophthora sp. Chile5]
MLGPGFNRARNDLVSQPALVELKPGGAERKHKNDQQPGRQGDLEIKECIEEKAAMSEAAEWLYLVSSNQVPEEETLENLTHLLKTKYANNMENDGVMAKIRERKQMPVDRSSDYGGALVEIGTGKDNDEKWCVNSFLNGMDNHAMAQLLKMQHPSSLTDAILERSPGQLQRRSQKRPEDENEDPALSPEEDVDAGRARLMVVVLSYRQYKQRHGRGGQLNDEGMSQEPTKPKKQSAEGPIGALATKKTKTAHKAAAPKEGEASAVK